MRQNIYDDETFFAGYQSLRAAPDTYNSLVEGPAMRALLPTDLAGAQVLDLGCGAGGLAALCVERGAAHVVATDISERMLAQAREHNPDPHIEYVRAAMEELDFGLGRFDLVVSSLALHYVADYQGIVSKVAHWLTFDGAFVFSAEHPMWTAIKDGAQGWCRDDAGGKRHWPVDDYADEGRREVAWFVEGVVKYHRTLTTLLNTLTKHGLTVETVAEPTALDETVARLPDYGSTRRCPPFLLVRSRKDRPQPG